MNLDWRYLARSEHTKIRKSCPENLAENHAQETHTDYRGNFITHYWELCCQRLRATVDRDGASTSINNSDANGNHTHSTVLGIDPTTLAENNWRDPSDEDTVLEITTRYDGRNRPTHSTTWLITLGEVNPKARTSLGTGEVPIATDPAEGLTTALRANDECPMTE